MATLSTDIPLNSTPPDEIRKLLIQATFVPRITAQVSGYLPFSLTPLNELNISYLSKPFLWLVVQLIISISILVSYVYLTSSESNSKIVTNEEWSYTVIQTVLNFSSCATRIISLMTNKSTRDFYQDFNTTLTEVFLNNRNINGLSSLKGSVKTGNRFGLKRIWCLIALIQLVWISYHVLEFFENYYWKLWVKCVAIGGSIIFDLFTLLFFSYVYWLVSIINCMRLGFQFLEQHGFDTFRNTSGQSSRNTQPSMALLNQEKELSLRNKL